MPGTTTLAATVTANSKNTETFFWTIDKSVNPDTWNLVNGGSGTSTYTITVTKSAGVDEATISGQVCVTNGGANPTENLAITVDLKINPNTPIITGQPVDVSGHPVLISGETHCYDYSITLSDGQIVPGATYKVTANVTITNHAGHVGVPFGPSPSDTTIFPQQSLVHNSISVTDTNGFSFTTSTTTTRTYTRTFTCPDDAGTHQNTATITFLDDGTTGPSDDATVVVNCITRGLKFSI